MKELFFDEFSSIKSALKQVSKGGKKCLIIVDDKKRLLGTLSDGDIRRAILNNKDINSSITSIYNKRPFYFEKGKVSKKEMEKVFKEKRLDLIPVLNKKGQVIEVISWDTFLKDQPDFSTSLADIPVVIMAGGKGTRLAPFTDVLPKPLIPVGGRTVIETIIDKFRDYGVKDFYISINHKAKILKAFFQELEPEYNVTFIEEKKPLGTAGSLILLKNTLKSTFFVTNCDIIINDFYPDLLNFHLSKSNDLSLVASARDFVIPYGTCELDKEGFLKKINEKPKFDFLVNTGLYIMEEKILDLIPKNSLLDANELIILAKKEKYKIGVYPIDDDSWLDVGQWEEYRKVIQDF